MLLLLILEILNLIYESTKCRTIYNKSEEYTKQNEQQKIQISWKIETKQTKKAEIELHFNKSCIR